jgi:hypothetical protein
MTLAVCACPPPLRCVFLQVGPGGIKLYKFVQSGTSGSWSLMSSAAKPRFYDVNEDNRGGLGRFHVCLAGTLGMYLGVLNMDGVCEGGCL